MKPRLVTPWFREMPWGIIGLEPWFPRQGARIGEVWFRGDEEPLPILVKFIFTTDKLSVQVHPDDEDAQRLEGTPGKTEMWHILHAEPEARIALGLRQRVSPERLREAALAGELEPLLHWIAVLPGQTYFIYPGTIHTIGPGVILCEIQQHRDLTYRLYDYGRPRELHLDKALEVANLGPHPGRVAPVDLGGGRQLLAVCKYFAVELWELHRAATYRPAEDRLQLLIILEGEGRLAGEPFRLGQVWLVPAGAEPFPIEPHHPARLLQTFVPE
jgi:mannose-6-phosphate isomerase